MDTSTSMKSKVQFLSGNGDFSVFLIGEIKRRNGRILQESAPIIDTAWKYLLDEWGFQIQLRTVTFKVIHPLMVSLLGEPVSFCEENLEGFPQARYDTRTSGLHIQLVGMKHGVFIVGVGDPKRNGLGNGS